MELKPKNVDAKYINSDQDYTVMKILGRLTLVYGSSRTKNCKGIAFKNTDMVREVCSSLIDMANLIDITKEKQNNNENKDPKKT